MKIDKELYEKISEITGIDYEAITYKDPDIEYVLVFTDAVVNMLEDLLAEYHHKEEELSDHKAYCEEWHYTKYDPYEEYGVSERDFF